MEQILSTGFDPQWAFDRETILHIAASQPNNSEIISKLVKKGCEVNIANEMQFTPLHCAMLFGDILNLNMLLGHGANIESVVGSSRQTVLHLATISNNLHAVKLLIQNRANVDAVDCSQNTPLIYSIQKKYFDIFKFLLKSKASCRMTARNCDTPIVFAIKSHCIDYVKCLLLQEPSCVDDVDVHGNTPLITAARENQLDMVQLLFCCNGDVTATNNSGDKAVDVAKEKGFTAIVEYLARQDTDSR